MSGSSKHALIIEDELLVGMDMQAVLSGLGFGSFAFASTAYQALEQARLRRPDLVTADITLLDGDGLDACAALEAACGPLPIICVTGQPEAVAGRNRAVVTKPFTAADIARACAQVLGTPEAA
jgi:CheY-like chemotaxis protein